MTARSTLELAEELVRRVRAGHFDSGNPRQARVLGYLSMLLDSRLDCLGNKFSHEKVVRAWSLSSRHPGFNRELLAGATVVELGCGALNPLTGLSVFLLFGAARGIGIDVQPMDDPSTVARALFRCMTEALASPSRFAPGIEPDREALLANLAGFDLERLRLGDPTGIDQDRLSYRVASVYESGLADGEVDVSISLTMLEHIDDVDRALAELARVTRPGGIATHVIDGTDHRHYRDPSLHPLAFLTHDAEARMVYHTNRIRPLRFRERFERHGFEVVAVRPTRRIELTEEIRAALVEPWASLPREDLEVLIATYHVRRR